MLALYQVVSVWVGSWFVCTTFRLLPENLTIRFSAPPSRWHFCENSACYQGNSVNFRKILWFQCEKRKIFDWRRGGLRDSGTSDVRGLCLYSNVQITSLDPVQEDWKVNKISVYKYQRKAIQSVCNCNWFWSTANAIILFVGEKIFLEVLFSRLNGWRSWLSYGKSLWISTNQKWI